MRRIIVFLVAIFTLIAGGSTFFEDTDTSLEHQYYYVDSEPSSDILLNYNLTYGSVTFESFIDSNACYGHKKGHDVYCVDYMGMTDYVAYGTKNIPFWIDSTFSDNMKIYISDAAKKWNSVYMHDGTSQIVNFYEVNSTDNINGKKVCKIIKDESLASGISGSFDFNAFTIKIKESKASSAIPVHELGHVLGLGDTDTNGDTAYHLTLMGYMLDVCEPWFQDIQGAAGYSGAHTTHDYRIYVYNENSSLTNKYYYKCLYCNRTRTYSEPLPSTKEWIHESQCSHPEKKLILSSDTKHWYRCVDCYKTFTNGNAHNILYEYDKSYHYETCTVCERQLKKESHDLYMVNYTFFHCNDCDYVGLPKNPPIIIVNSQELIDVEIQKLIGAGTFQDIKIG